MAACNHVQGHLRRYGTAGVALAIPLFIILTHLKKSSLQRDTKPELASKCRHTHAGLHLCVKNSIIN